MNRETHLAAILATRTEWPEEARIRAEQLAALREKLDAVREQAGDSSPTIPTANGESERTNPVFRILEQLSRQEAREAKGLGLGLKVTRGGRTVDAVRSPQENRETLWAVFWQECRENLIPGMWAHWTRMLDCDIAEDAIGFPNNPLELPVSGEPPKFATDYPVHGPGLLPNTCGEKQPGYERALDLVIADRRARGLLKPPPKPRGRPRKSIK